ncbi:hypothetical protein DOY81_006421 [Sarcophaga bullata]|nr:hypothetical protein DOY81_006421 [Sarcophaga bullata]
MDVHRSGQKDQVEKLYEVAGFSTSDIISSEQKLSNLNINRNSQDEIHQQESNHEESNGPVKSIKKQSEVKYVKNADDNSSSAIDDHNDENDVIVGQLRFGCEKDLQNQEYKYNVHSGTACNMLKANVPTNNRKDIRNSNALDFSNNSLYTPSSSVIPLAGQNTTKTKVISSSSLDQVESSEKSGETIRGKKVTPYIDTKDCTDFGSLATNNPMAYELACQSTSIANFPLHVRNTSNHYHQYHKENLNHYYNLCENERLSNEFTSRFLSQITNSPHCTNLDSYNIRKRHSSFLKSQSLEIAQDTPNVLYNEIDDVEHPFFQLPQTETNEEKDLQLSDPTSNLQTEEQLQKCTRNSLIANDDETKEEYHENKNCENVEVDPSVVLHKTGVALKPQSLESRPIYPNVPYSPYASPYSSPRTNRRRPPLRESRRISIEKSGSFLQLNQYKLMDQIGQGSYGLVKLAYSEEDSTHYAMKILSKRRLLRQAGLMKRGPKKGTSPLDRVYREIAVLKKLDHPNVVKLVEVLDDPVEDSLYMVFELVKQGEVLSVPTKNPLTEERAWSVFRDTLLGLEYLHYQRIIHADIKPGNLLLTECGRVKIADLGVCNEFVGEDATMTNGSTAGTPAFRAPESLNVGQNIGFCLQNIYCGKAADVWALGATLYALVYGNVPFVASSVPILYEKIKHEEFVFPENPKTSAELKDCIKCMLNKDPTKRITIPQLKEHAWVTSGGLYPLPSEEENCRLVQVNDDDINTVVRSIPKLDTLILIKTMLKKHSFGNPFSRGISGRAPQRGGSRLERFIRAGRSNSAPGSYNMIVDRQV